MSTIANRGQSLTELPSASTIESSKLRVNGHQAHYLKAGSGPPVTLLHGGASNSQDWMETLNALSDSYSLYAPDMPGFGLSDRDKNGYYLSDFVEFTLGFIREVSLDSQILVGHSIGGRVCLEIALRHPEMVRRLILVDTVGFVRLTSWGMSLGALAWGLRKVLRARQPYPKFLKKHGEDKDWLCIDQLPGLKVPTLLVWNRRDPYYPMSGALRAKELIPDVRLKVFSGFGHAPHLQQSDCFNSVLLDFLNHDQL